MQRSIVVQATPERVWALINDATNIRPEEFGSTWAARIGVPMPLSGVTESTADGRVRVSRWAKGVQFDEPITDWQPGRFASLRARALRILPPHSNALPLFRRTSSSAPFWIPAS